MKHLLAGFVFFLGSASVALAHGHAQHNFVLFGEKEIYASHIVYKQPHNYQVILRLRLTEEVKSAYLATAKAHPAAVIRFKLDSMDVATIGSQAVLTGPILFDDESGVEQVAIPSVRVNRSEFDVLYFDELPLSLAGGH